MGAYNLIRQAIIDKRQIVAMYDGYRREMCPHVIGTKRGREQALFFQFAGESGRGLPPGGEWRCMPIDGLSGVEVREGPWHTAPNHSRPQTCVDIDRIDTEVKF